MYSNTETHGKTLMLAPGGQIKHGRKNKRQHILFTLTKNASIFGLCLERYFIRSSVFGVTPHQNAANFHPIFKFYGRELRIDRPQIHPFSIK